MTDNAKKALEFLKNNKEAMERLKKVNTIPGILDLAKEYNLDLTEEDLNITKEKRDILEGKKKIDLSELEKISGAGDICGCFVLGFGGTETTSLRCYCSGGGAGTGGSHVYCECFIAGGGNTDNDLGSADVC